MHRLGKQRRPLTFNKQNDEYCEYTRPSGRAGRYACKVCVYEGNNKMQDETEGSGEGGRYVQFIPAFSMRNVMRKSYLRHTGMFEARLR